MRCREQRSDGHVLQQSHVDHKGSEICPQRHVESRFGEDLPDPRNIQVDRTDGFSGELEPQLADSIEKDKGAKADEEGRPHSFPHPTMAMPTTIIAMDPSRIGVSFSA